MFGRRFGDVCVRVLVFGGGKDVVVMESVWRYAWCSWRGGGKCVAMPSVEVGMRWWWKVYGGALGVDGTQVESVWRYPW